MPSRRAPGPYVRLAQAIVLDPKLFGLSDAAFRAWTVGIALSAQAKADGCLVVEQVAGLFRMDAAELRKELTPDLWHEAGHTCERCEQPEVGQVMIHAFTEWQITAEEQREARERFSAAGRKGGWAKANARQNAKRTASTTLSTSPDIPLSTTLDRTLDTTSGTTSSQEEEEEENNNYTSSASASALPEGDRFDSFWSLYPRKVGKEAARNAFRKAVKESNASFLIAALEKHLPAMVQQETKFIPHASTWLNQKRYADEPEQPALRVVGQEPQTLEDLEGEDAVLADHWLRLHPIQTDTPELQRLYDEDREGWRARTRELSAERNAECLRVILSGESW